MTQGHRGAQRLFDDMGRAFGYRVERTFSKALPTDGVWFARRTPRPEDRIPVMAIEVVVSESRKVLRGSVLTLESVSPAVGVLLIHEGEIRRRMIRGGASSTGVEARVAALHELANALVKNSRQRFEIWSHVSLERRYRDVIGRQHQVLAA